MQNSLLSPLRTTVGAMAVGCVLIGVIASVIMAPPDESSLARQVLPVLLPLITAAAGWAFLRRPVTAVGTRTPAEQALETMRQRTIVAAGITEAGGLLAFAFGFVFELTPLVVTIAMVLAGILVLAVAWPRESRLQEWERELQRRPHR